MKASIYELTETENKILGILAKKGTKTYYDVYKKEKLCSSSTAWGLLKKLEKNGYIEVKKEQAFQLRGRKKKLYGLTFRGLIAALRQKEIWEHIDEVANQQMKLLPLIFGKWRHFKENVDTKKLIGALRWLWLDASATMTFTPEAKEHELIAVVMKGLPNYILGLTREPEERVSWLKTMHGDSELRRCMLDQEGPFVGWANMWSLSFSLMREQKPNWNKALEQLRNQKRVQEVIKKNESIQEHKKEPTFLELIYGSR